MCLAVPAIIIAIDKVHAWADTMGIRQRVNIQLLASVAPGDYILVHAGFAIEKIDPEQFNNIEEIIYNMLEVKDYE